MYVTLTTLREGTRLYEPGEVVAEADNWPPHIVAHHLRLGRMRDVSPEEAAKLGAEHDRRRLDEKRQDLTAAVQRGEAKVNGLSARRDSEAKALAKLDQAIAHERAALERDREALAASPGPAPEQTQAAPEPSPVEPPTTAEQVPPSGTTPPPASPAGEDVASGGARQGRRGFSKR